LARPDHSPPRAVVLPPTIDRDNVDGLVARCRATMATGRGMPVMCDAADVVDPRLPTVETIARLALDAHRNRQEFRLERASPALLDLLAFCGLTIRTAESDGLGETVPEGERDPTERLADGP
jgi:hypothetical protein